MNLHLQGAGKFVSSLCDHVKAFQRKLKLLQKQLKKDLFYFTVCNKLIEEDRNDNETLLLLRSEKYTNMFEDVKLEFQRRFSDFHLHKTEFMLFSDPFHCSRESALTIMQLELIELQKSCDLKIVFPRHTVGQVLFLSSSHNFSRFAQACLGMASFFVSTYICEKTFSVMYFCDE